MTQYYPQHEQLKRVQPISQKIHEFVLEFLQGRGIHLAEYVDEDSDRLYCTNESITNLVAEFLEIDLKELEKEKQAMIEEMRSAHEQRIP